MSEYTVRATLTVTGDEADRAKIQAGLDAGLKELPAVAIPPGGAVPVTWRLRRSGVMTPLRNCVIVIFPEWVFDEHSGRPPSRHALSL